MKKKLLSISSLMAIILTITLVPINTFASEGVSKKPFTQDGVNYFSEKYNMSVEEVEAVNDFSLLNSKMKELNNVKPVVTEKTDGNSIIRTETKTVFLDDAKKLPITITNTYETPKVDTSSVAASSSTLTYTTSGDLVAVGTGYQRIKYTIRSEGINQIFSTIQAVDAWATGPGPAWGISSSYSSGERLNNWADTLFTGNIAYLNFVIECNTVINNYGVFDSTWSVSP